MASFRATGTVCEGRRNAVAVIGHAQVGKSHLIRSLGERLELRTKYYNADVEVVEHQCGDNDAALLGEARAWVVMVQNTPESFALMAENLDVTSAPDRRLLVINQTGEGVGDDVHSFCFTDEVFNWCMSNQFEAIPRMHQVDATVGILTGEDKEALLSLRLLDETEPVGAARVFQALSQTVWEDTGLDDVVAAIPAGAPVGEATTPDVPPSVKNLARLVYFEVDGYPLELASFLGGNGIVENQGEVNHSIDNKYYRADVSVEVVDIGSVASELFSSCHAGIVCTTSEQSLKAFLDSAKAGPPSGPAWGLTVSPEVAMLVCSATVAGSVSEEASEWCLDNGFEYLQLSDFSEASRGDDEETVQRVREALESTEWPQMDMGPKKSAEPTVAGKVTDGIRNEAPTDGRWQRRWASGIGTTGCELAPGWIFDRSLLRSRQLDTLAERAQQHDGTLMADDDSSAASDEQEAIDYERLFQEAMFLRNKGSSLDPDERHERAAEVAMRLAGHY